MGKTALICNFILFVKPTHLKKEECENYTLLQWRRVERPPQEKPGGSRWQLAVGLKKSYENDLVDFFYNLLIIYLFIHLRGLLPALTEEQEQKCIHKISKKNPQNVTLNIVSFTTHQQCFITPK